MNDEDFVKELESLRRVNAKLDETNKKNDGGDRKRGEDRKRDEDKKRSDEKRKTEDKKKAEDKKKDEDKRKKEQKEDTDDDIMEITIIDKKTEKEKDPMLSAVGSIFN